MLLLAIEPNMFVHADRPLAQTVSTSVVQHEFDSRSVSEGQSLRLLSTSPPPVPLSSAFSRLPGPRRCLADACRLVRASASLAPAELITPCSSFVLACVYGGLIVYTHVREGKKLWLWRLVSRTQGRYILGNAANLWVICCLVNIVLQIAFVSLVYEIYAHDGSQSSIYFWRTLVLIPIVVHGHVATWNMLQVRGGPGSCSPSCG